MEQAVVNVQIGDRVGIGPAPNSHGCQDFAICVKLASGDFEVIEAESCHSCWQVGHDRDHVFYAVGDIIPANELALRPAGNDWARSIKWEA